MSTFPYLVLGAALAIFFALVAHFLYSESGLRK